jgi:signal transduction histidine kinase
MAAHPDNRALVAILRKRGVRSLLDPLSEAVPGGLCIEGADNEVLYGTLSSTTGEILVVGGRAVGWVRPARAADVVAAILEREAERRTLVAETLSRFRELNLLYGLGARLAGCESADEVGRVVVAELERCLGPDSAVLFDAAPSAESVATRMQWPAVAYRVVQTAQAELENVEEHSIIAAPLGGGCLVLTRPSSQTWTAGDLALVASATDHAGAVLDGVRATMLRMEEQLAAREALAQANAELASAFGRAERASHAKTTFLACMSHELHTPTNAVLGYIELALKQSDESSRSAGGEADLERAMKAARALSAALDDLLVLAEVEAGERAIHARTVDVVELVEQLADSVGRAVTHEGPRISVEADPDVLERCLHRLLERTEEGALHIATEGCCTVELGEPSGDWREVGSGSELDGEPGLGLSVTNRLLHILGARLSVDQASQCAFRLQLP